MYVWWHMQIHQLGCWLDFLRWNLSIWVSPWLDMCSCTFFEFILGLNNVLLSMIDNETLVFFCETRLQTQTLTYTSAHWWLRLSQNLLAQSFEVCLYEWVVCMYVSLCIVIQKNILDLSSLYIICYVAYISNLNLDLRDF